MKRPTKQQVIAAIKSDYESGRKRLLDAVELKSGVIIIEYEVRREIKDLGTHVQIRVLVEMPNGTWHGVIRQSYFADKRIKTNVK